MPSKVNHRLEVGIVKCVTSGTGGTLGFKRAESSVLLLIGRMRLDPWRVGAFGQRGQLDGLARDAHNGRPPRPDSTCFLIEIGGRLNHSRETTARIAGLPGHAGVSKCTRDLNVLVGLRKELSTFSWTPRMCRHAFEHADL